MSTHNFCGGPLDGQRRAMSNPPPRVFLVALAPPFSLADEDVAPSHLVEVWKSEYHLNPHGAYVWTGYPKGYPR